MQTKLEASNLFLQGLVMWYGHDVIVNIFDVWDDHYCIVATGRSLMVVFNFISIHHVVVLFQSSCNSCYTWWTTMKTAPLTLTPRRRWWRSCPLMMEDHVRALEMKIKGAKTKGPYHITYELHVMLILLCILYCLDRDGSIIRWSLSLNIKIIKCSSLVFTIAKTYRFEASRDDRVW